MITAAPTSVCHSGITDQTKKSIRITQAMPEYSSGATLAAGACLNALVMPHCPTAPVTAIPPMIR